MSHLDELIDEVDSLLGGMTTNLGNASQAFDAYEAYLWTLVVVAAYNLGADINLLDRDGRSPSSLLFRTSPGSIFADAPKYTFARLNFHGCPALEVHQGIYVLGRSRVKCECDVVVVDERESNMCRRSRVHPRYSKTMLSIEAKFNTSGLGIALGRGFLGLTTETYTPGRFFASNNESNSIKKLLTHHHRLWEMGLFPGEPRTQDRIVKSFETCFKDYQARFL